MTYDSHAPLLSVTFRTISALGVYSLAPEVKYLAVCVALEEKELENWKDEERLLLLLSLFIYLFFWPHSLWDLSSLTRD